MPGPAKRKGSDRASERRTRSKWGRRRYIAGGLGGWWTKVCVCVCTFYFFVIDRNHDEIIFYVTQKNIKITSDGFQSEPQFFFFATATIRL